MDIRNRYYISFSNDFDTQKKNLFIENFKKNEYFSSFKYIEPNVNYTKHIKSEYYIENGELVTFDEYVSDEKYIKFLTNNNTANNNTSSNKGTLNNTNNTPINNKTANNTMNNTPMNNTPMNNTPMNNKPTDNVTTGGVPTTLDNNGNTVNDKSAKSKCQQEYKILIFDNEKDAMNAYRNDILKQEKEMRKIYLSQQDDIEQQGDIDQQEDDYISIEDFIISFKSLTEFTLYSKYYLYQDELIDELVTKVENIYSIYDDDKLAFTNLQILTSNALMKTLKGNVNMNTIPEIEFNYKVMDKPKYNKKVEEDAAQDTVPLFMLFYFVPCICSLLSNLVIEKESKIKESLVIVGMKKSMFWLSWAITYGIIIVIASFIASYVINYLKIFVSIHWLILFVTFTIYGLSCICISFALSTLINKSKTSNTIGALVILTYFALYFFNIFVKNETARWIACFALPPVSFLSLMEYLIKLENQKLPTTFLTMLDNSLLRNYFFSIIGSLFIYFFLALYLDNVLPQGSNLHKKWHFFITDLLRCCRSKNRRNNDDGYYYNNHTQANQNNPFIQKDPEGLRKSVEVRHIGRNFKAKEGKLEILKDINFNAYYDEIFAILGHNGAGKTTLLRIMTGVLSSSRGEVYYDNIPIRGNETDVCKQFGYCPQFDTFSKNLTVEEHVKLFAGIKGIKVDVDEVLKDIDLLNKKKNFPKQLSGGQRRKLCITLALLGSPNYVFLDEPTTGLDPYSRKNIWELLSRKKKGCTMFVTTHYMDEADLLADRKMIISNGNITCLGTSIFLKKTFNMNYSLDITLGREKDIYYIDPLIDYYCPGATNTKVINASQYEVIDNNHINHNNSTGNRNNRRRPNNNNNNNNNRNNNKFIVTYLLPMDHVNHFKDIFKALNDLINRNNNSISNFSITAPTLEELFIKLERNKMENQMDRDIQKVKNVATVDMNSYDDGDTKRLINNLNPVFGKTNINKSSAFRQIYSIVKIRLKIFLRNKTFAFIYTLFPICLIVACIYFENKFIDSSYDSNETYKPLEMKPTLYNKVTWFKDTKASNGIALDIINKVNIGNNPYEEVDYENQLTIKSNQLNPDQSKIYIGGFSGVVNNNNNNNNINNNINNNNLLNNNNRQVLDFTIYHDICYTFSIPIGINYIYNTILEHYNINKQFLVTYNPLPRYYLEDYDENDKEGIINKGPELTRLSMESILSLAMALAISLSISTFGPLTVKEREEGITWQLFLNGTSRMNYWIGVLISDTICIFVPTLLIVLAGYFNEISIFGMNVIAFSVTVTLLWIMGSLVHQYVVSHFFKRYDKCSNLFIILNPILTLFAGIYCLVAVINQEEVDETERAKAEMNESSNAKILRYIFYVILVLYVPSTIVYYYTKISGFVGRYKLNISEDKYLSFSQSKLYQDIANNANLSKVEKSKQAAKAFFKLNSPTFNDFIKSKDAKYCAIIVLGLILLYVIILYIRIRSQTKSLKSHKKYTKNEIKIKNKKLMDGPSDVYNEFKRVQQKINENDKTKVNVNVTINNDNNNYNNYDNHYYNYNNDNNNNNNYNNNYNNNNNSSSNNNNISMMSYRLNKDYSITLSEMQKKKREKAKEDKIEDKYENKKSKQNDFINEEGKDKNRNKNDSIKESAFTKMDDRITYDKTKKIYTNRIVDDVTFGVDAGQCLGLLGPNGAGKTTSIYMMTGLVPRTHGRVVYGNNDLDNTDLSGLSLGYCAQHDSLWKLLTVKETIQFYLNICGYPHKDIPYYTKSLIEACGIENHTNKKVSEISGGTKRKLSLIIAICSSPSYLILDEPSAGMDPFTRRYMWRLISQLKKVRETSTILTTHSTEEAEALCDRIAILIKGNLVCIDTPNSIKMNQSNRYVLEVFTDHPQEFEEVYIMRYNLFGLDQTISEKQYNVESSFNHQKYTVEMKTQNIANVFSVMEMAKRRGHISQYNFGQYSLEQIFIDFVNNTK